MFGTLLESKRGGKLLIDQQNYIYTRVNTKGDRRNYKCLEFRREGCKATARTGVEEEDEKRIYAVTDHNHASSIANVDFLKAEMSAITKARNNVALPPRVILGDISNELAAQGHTLPKSGNALIQTMQRARVKAGGHPNVPKTFDEVLTMIPAEKKLTASGDCFLQYAGKVTDVDDPVMLIFMSPFGRELMKNSSNFFADGTFKTCPLPFKQVHNHQLKFN